MKKQKLLKAFVKNIKTKKFSNNGELDFWLVLAPYLDEEVLDDLNQDLIDERLNKLKE